MQEVLVYTNRRTRAKVTAWGGFVAGCLVAGLLSGGWQWHQGQQEQLRLQAAFEAERKLLTGQRDDARGQVKANAARYNGEPLDWLSVRAVRNLAELEKRLAQFPEFKTESYRIPFQLLRAEVASQSTEAASLAKAVRAIPSGSRCALVEVAEAPALWAEGEVVLTARGWVGAGRAGAAP